MPFSELLELPSRIFALDGAASTIAGQGVVHECGATEWFEKGCNDRVGEREEKVEVVE